MPTKNFTAVSAPNHRPLKRNRANNKHNISQCRRHCFHKNNELLFWKSSPAFGGEALSRAEPPAGPPKNTKIAGESIFRKIRAFFGLTGPTLRHLVLFEKNFPRPLAFRIRNYMHLSPLWTLLSEILRQDREISSFLSKNFRDFRLAF